jgi:hypothetical protein
VHTKGFLKVCKCAPDVAHAVVAEASKVVRLRVRGVQLQRVIEGGERARPVPELAAKLRQVHLQCAEKKRKKKEKTGKGKKASNKRAKRDLFWAMCC